MALRLLVDARRVEAAAEAMSARGGGRPMGWRDHVIGAVLCVLYVGALLGTSSAIGFARDEGFYLQAAERYGAWLSELAHAPSVALAREHVDSAWSINPEHPPLMKIAFALALQADRALHLAPRPSDAVRFPSMCTAGLLVWLVYVFGARAFGRRAGAFAAAALASTPRFFHHAHLACLDVPVAFFVVLATYAYWRALRRRAWAWGAGLAFAAALATKHTAWLLPPVLLVHWLVVLWGARAARDAREPVVRFPWWLVAMGALGPLVLALSWPWLWHDGAARFWAYAGFHVSHVQYDTEFMGRNWFRPPFPASYALVMTAVTVPTVTLALAVIGLVSQRATLVPRWVRSVWARVVGAATTHATPDARRTDLLLLLGLAWPLLLFSTTRTPIFGGTKHFLAAFPFIAFWAGSGFLRVSRAVRSAWAQMRGSSAGVRSTRALLTLATGALLLAPPLAQTAHAHPFGLSSYVPLAGGAPGAADAGFVRQYWGQTTRTTTPLLRAMLPSGGRVWPGDGTFAAWRVLQLDGHLPRSVIPVRTMREADVVLVHHERHFLEVELQAWVALGSPLPRHVVTFDGVPIVSVYARPARVGLRTPQPGPDGTPARRGSR